MKPLRTGQKIYVACRVVTEIDIEPRDASMRLMMPAFDKSVMLTWIDGQIGACPVFTDRRKALKYSKDILTFTVGE